MNAWVTYEGCVLLMCCGLLQRQMKELMVRAVYCEMLGYEASFSYIHAIKLAQQGTALDKRVGTLSGFFVVSMYQDILK